MNIIRSPFLLSILPAQNIIILNICFCFVFKITSKSIPKPNIFISGSRTNRSRTIHSTQSFWQRWSEWRRIVGKVRDMIISQKKIHVNKPFQQNNTKTPIDKNTKKPTIFWQFPNSPTHLLHSLTYTLLQPEVVQGIQYTNHAHFLLFFILNKLYLCI